MSWKIDYTAEARQDLRDIFEYIANVLYEPDTAKRQVGKIIEKIDGLDTLPFHFFSLSVVC